MRIRLRLGFILLLQLLLIFLSLIVAWLLRFNFGLPHLKLLLAAFPVLAFMRLVALVEFNLLHGYWRYTGVSDAQDVVKAVIAGSVGFYVMERWVLGVAAFPGSIYILEAVLTAAALGGIRLVSRAVLQSIESGSVPMSRKRVLIVGAGDAGAMLARALPRTGFIAAAFVDDDHAKVGARLCGVPVLGTIDKLPAIARRLAVDELLIAIPSATREQMRRIVDLCLETHVPSRMIPGYAELIDKTVRVERLVDQLREIRFEDLLGREAVRLAAELPVDKLAGKGVMVTGAAGSIGSELCAQILQLAPERLLCVDQDESGLFFLKQRLEQRSTACKIEYHVADIANRQRMMQIFDGHEIVTVFHAAAYKHVPLMESNVREAISNNIFGLLSLLDVAVVCGCRSFVAISSDKAVNPTSVMGCTKRVGELILAARPHGEMRCISVRFGNVLGSQGSVVPLFQEQIRKHGRVTVTHPEVSRFFMTVSEAVSLVLQAFAVGRHGEILVLDMGESMRIVDMVHMLIRLLGKSENEVEITYTGLRAGEKLYEELFYKGEDPLPTECGKVMRTRGKPTPWGTLKDYLDELSVLVSSDAPDDAIRSKLQQIVPEFRGLHETSQTLSVDTPLPILEAPGVGSD